MSASASPSSLDRAWERQSVWSQVAGQLKRNVKRWRAVVLMLTITGGALTAVAVVVGLESGGKVFAFAGALCVALAALARPYAGRNKVRDWTRARSASEALKSECFLYQTGAGEGGADEPAKTFERNVEAIERDVADLLRCTRGIDAQRRSPPDVHDVPSYVSERVSRQISEYYRPQAARQQQLLIRARAAEIALAVLAAALAAAAGTWGLDAVAVWVPVVTTVSAAVIAYAAAERYEYLVVEYLRTAAELERLRDRHARSEVGDAELVKACEHVISVQNEGWMAKLTADDGTAG